MNNLLGILWRVFFFNKFPPYFRNNDSYKNDDGEGLMQRFLQVPGEYMEFLEPYADNWVLNVRDIISCYNEFVANHANTLGNPPNIFPGDPDYIRFRKFLWYIVSIYKIKGTLKSYQVLFEALGFSVELLEVPFTPSLWDYSSYPDEYNGLNPLQIALLGLEADVINWDEFNWDEVCQQCVYYYILVSNLTDDPENQTYAQITAEELENLLEIVALVEPIDAVLLGLMQSINIEELVGIDVDEEINITCQTYTIFDEVDWDEFNWDDFTESCDEDFEFSLGDYNNDYNPDHYI